MLTTMLTLDTTTLFYYLLSNATFSDEHSTASIEDWAKDVPAAKVPAMKTLATKVLVKKAPTSNPSVAPSLTKGSTRTNSKSVSSRSALNNAFIRLRDDDLAEMTENEEPLSDRDETKGAEHEAAVKSPPKGKRRVTSSVSNKPLYFIFLTTFLFP
jgi:hypothetical protein